MLHIRGWPRWCRENVLHTHPCLSQYGIEQVLSTEDPTPSCQDTCLYSKRVDDDPEVYFRTCLDKVNERMDGVYLTEGFDRDGTVHDDERILLTRLVRMVANNFMYEDNESDDANKIKQEDDNENFRSDETPPKWLTEAERVLVKDHQEQSFDENAIGSIDVLCGVISQNHCPPSSPSTVVTETTENADEDCVVSEETPKTTPEPSPVETPKTTPGPFPMETTQFVTSTGSVVERVHGVLTPPLLTYLAQQRASVLSSASENKLVVFKLGQRMCVGRLTIDMMSYDTLTATYKCEQHSVSGLAPTRRQGDVSAMHTLARRRYESR